MTTSVSALVTTLLQFVKTDELKLAAPVLATFFTNVSSNTGQLNLANQLLLLQAGLQATFPQLETDVAKEINTLVQAEIASVLATATPAA